MAAPLSHRLFELMLSPLQKEIAKLPASAAPVSESETLALLLGNFFYGVQQAFDGLKKAESAVFDIDDPHTDRIAQSNIITKAERKIFDKVNEAAIALIKNFDQYDEFNNEIMEDLLPGLPPG